MSTDYIYFPSIYTCGFHLKKGRRVFATYVTGNHVFSRISKHSKALQPSSTDIIHSLVLSLFYKISNPCIDHNFTKYIKPKRSYSHNWCVKQQSNLIAFEVKHCEKQCGVACAQVKDTLGNLFALRVRVNRLYFRG